MQALASPGRRADVGSMTSPPTGRRLLLAFLVAPLAAPTAFVLAVIAGQAVGTGLASARSALDLAIAVFALGAPLAYVATLVAGAPAYFALLAFGLVRRWTVWIGAATIGAATAFALSPYLGKEFFRIQFPWWAGALVGLVSAEVFWRVRERP